MLAHEHDDRAAPLGQRRLQRPLRHVRQHLATLQLQHARSRREHVHHAGLLEVVLAPLEGLAHDPDARAGEQPRGLLPLLPLLRAADVVAVAPLPLLTPLPVVPLARRPGVPLATRPVVLLAHRPIRIPRAQIRELARPDRHHLTAGIELELGPVGPTLLLHNLEHATRQSAVSALDNAHPLPFPRAGLLQLDQLFVEGLDVPRLPLGTLRQHHRGGRLSALARLDVLLGVLLLAGRRVRAKPEPPRPGNELDGGDHAVVVPSHGFTFLPAHPPKHRGAKVLYGHLLVIVQRGLFREVLDVLLKRLKLLLREALTDETLLRGFLLGLGLGSIPILGTHLRQAVHHVVLSRLPLCEQIRVLETLLVVGVDRGLVGYETRRLPSPTGSNLEGVFLNRDRLDHLLHLVLELQA